MGGRMPAAAFLLVVPLLLGLTAAGCAGDGASTTSRPSTTTEAPVTISPTSAPASVPPPATALHPAADWDRGYGYIDNSGAWIIQPQFKYAGEFFDGLAPVLLNEVPEHWAYIDTTGGFAFEGRFDGATEFSEGLAVVKVEKAASAFTSSCIDTGGAVVFEIPADMVVVSAFRDGPALVAMGDDYGYIDSTGGWVLEPRFMGARDFSEGLAPVQNFSGLFGYIDKTGEWALDPRFEAAWPFSEGLGLVAVDGAYGFINAQGEFVIAPRFEAGYPFSEGLAAVQVGEAWGYIDPTGAWVLEPRYALALPFRGGLASVLMPTAPGGLEYECAYIDASGGFVFWKGHYKNE